MNKMKSPILQTIFTFEMVGFLLIMFWVSAGLLPNASPPFWATVVLCWAPAGVITYVLNTKAPWFVGSILRMKEEEPDTTPTQAEPERVSEAPRVEPQPQIDIEAILREAREKRG